MEYDRDWEDGLMEGVRSMQQALWLSCQKWHPENPFRGKGGCALCGRDRNTSKGRCEECPLVSCGPESLWGIWDCARDRGILKEINDAADALYQRLLKLYKQEVNGAQ